MRAGESNAVIELSVLVRQGPQQCHYRGSLEAGFRAGKITATVLSRHRQEERHGKKDTIHIWSPFFAPGLALPILVLSPLSLPPCESLTENPGGKARVIQARDEPPFL